MGRENDPLMQRLVNDGDATAAIADGPRRTVSFWIIAVCLIVVQIGFGGYGIIVRKFAQFAHANSIVFSFYRDLGCWPTLLLASRLLEGPFQYPSSRFDLAIFIALGLTGMFGGQLFYIMGVYFAGPDVASMYQPAMPVWAAVFVIIAGVEKVPNILTLKGVLKVGGVLLAAGGAVIMGVAKKSGSAKHQQQAFLGAMFSLTNTVLFALYVTIQKKYIFQGPKAPLWKKWGQFPIYVTAWSYMFGAIFMIAGAFAGYYTEFGLLGFGADIGLCPLVGPSITWHNQTWNGAGCPNQNQTTSLHPCDQSGEYPCHEQWKYICHGDGDGDAVGRCRLKTKTLSIPAGSVGPIMYAVFITSALNYGLITFANKNCTTSVVSAFWPFQVFVAVILSYMVFGETINAIQGLGGALIIVGLGSVIASESNSDEAPP